MSQGNNALIGHTGFVGSNILVQSPFAFTYNSKNIGEIQNKTFELVVCAGAPGTKWIANKNPEADLSTIQKLMDNLKTINCKRLVLISTIDVYSPASGVDENTQINKDILQPYAKHRRQLEEFVENNFDSLIIRLPGIFGQGLKKNVIYDLLNGSTQNINPASQLQFYWLNYIWADITKALEQNLKVINFATEPIKLKELADKVFNLKLSGEINTPPAYYDMHTKNAPLWGISEKPYLYLKDKVLEDLKTFIKTAA